jgi:hypothetical protein
MPKNESLMKNSWIQVFPAWQLKLTKTVPQRICVPQKYRRSALLTTTMHSSKFGRRVLYIRKAQSSNEKIC